MVFGGAEGREALYHRSYQPGDDMKDEVRTDDDWHAWRIWSSTRDRSGPGRSACYIGTLSWKSTRCFNLQNEKEEASRGCSFECIVANPRTLVHA